MHRYLYHQHHGNHSLPSHCRLPSLLSVNACKELWSSISSQATSAFPSSCPSFAAYMWRIAFTDNLVYNGWKQACFLQTSTSFCSLGIFQKGFSNLSTSFVHFFGCGEATAPCCLWFPLLNRCWWYYVLQMRHLINCDEDKELLQVGEGGIEWGGGGQRVTVQINPPHYWIFSSREKRQTSEKSCFNSLPLHYLFHLLAQNNYKYAALLETASLKIKCTFQRLCTI